MTPWPSPWVRQCLLHAREMVLMATYDFVKEYQWTNSLFLMLYHVICLKCYYLYVYVYFDTPALSKDICSNLIKKGYNKWQDNKQVDSLYELIKMLHAVVILKCDNVCQICLIWTWFLMIINSSYKQMVILFIYFYSFFRI